MRYWPFFVNRALEIIYCDDDSDDDDLKTHLFASCVSALVHWTCLCNFTTFTYLQYMYIYCSAFVLLLCS